MLYPSFLSPHVVPIDFATHPILKIVNQLRWYSLMYVLGFLIAYVILNKLAKKGDIQLTTGKNGNLQDLFFYAFIGLIIGARLGDYILYRPWVFIKAPWELIGFYASAQGGVEFRGLMGLSFHGGMLGMIIAFFIFSRRYKIPFFHITDYTCLVVPFGLFFGRLGNFINAELWGHTTQSNFGIRFPLYAEKGGYFAWKKGWEALGPNLQKVAENLNQYYGPLRHPSQLYEALLEGVLIFLVVFGAYRLKARRGVMSWIFIMLYGLFRFLVEFVRAPSDWAYGWFTGGMAYSLPMFIIGAVMLFITMKRPPAAAADIK